LLVKQIAGQGFIFLLHFQHFKKAASFEDEHNRAVTNELSAAGPDEFVKKIAQNVAQTIFG
jgi:hypothetical protein